MKTQSIRVIGEKVIELKKNLVTIYDSTLNIRNTASLLS